MKQFYYVIFCLFVSIVFNTCKTDFDVTAPYRETTVVYGLLNIADTIQWVRINKAFLGDENAYTMAQHPDSINYPDILDVKLEEYAESGAFVKTLNLVRDSSIAKEPGIFAVSPNILYRTNGIDTLDEDNEYKLVIYNRETGKTITAKTKVIGSIYMIYPLINAPSFQIAWYKQNTLTVKWTTVPEAVDYQLTIRFHYDEVNIADTTDVQAKYIDWTFPDQVISGTTNSQSQQIQPIAKDGFYNFVKSQVAPNVNVKRIIGPLDFIIGAAAYEFYTYIQVNKPPSGVNQNIPQYTNVDGGLGIFSSRLRQNYPGYIMDIESKDSLMHGIITGDLQFKLF